MNYVAQFDTGSLCEFGVQTKYLDRKGYFVGDALTCRMQFAPKFKIFGRVINFVTVFVMNSFFRRQFSSEGAFHHRAMHQLLFTSSEVQTHVSRRMQMAVGVNRAPSATFPAAFFRAKTLAFIIAGVSTVFGLAQASFLGFAAKFALKTRCGFLVHDHWLARRYSVVKENF